MSSGRIARAAAFGCMMWAVLAPRPAAGAELAEVAARVKPAVVHLVVYDSSGDRIGTATGFFVSADGLVATSYHVIEGAAAIEALLPDGGEAEILGVMGADANRDIVVLEAKGDGYAWLELAEAGEAREGVRVAVIGGPRGLSWTLSEGIVSALRDRLPDAVDPGSEHASPLIQITAPISPGSSGSPVVTLEGGRVIGVVQSTMPHAANISFAVPVEALRRVLERIPADAHPRPLHPIPWRNALISAAVFGGLGLAWFLGRLALRLRRSRGVRLVR